MMERIPESIRIGQASVDLEGVSNDTRWTDAVTFRDACGFKKGTRQPNPNRRMLATKKTPFTVLFLEACLDRGSQFMDNNSLQLQRRVFRAPHGGTIAL
ncbi:MAG: hypothetical protein NTV29_06915 [Planctomycetota bacterium]|nr:hypothetical protein [Planctomycetota bacterium]